MDEELVPRYTTWKPVFQAVEAMTPNFHFDEVDLMARGTILQELLSRPPAGAVAVVPRGFNDDLPAIEMKTGHWQRSIEQMWFSRVPYAVRPLFDPRMEHALVRAVEMRMVTPICRAWEEVEANQNSLRKLTALISQLREIVRGTEGKCCYVARVHGVQTPDLHIFVMEEGIMPVSERDMQKFWRNRHQ
ncbi:hypothetical protein DL769_001164 [Monosporascus sp. CRB-8-3]|nr:hypothetical protein DL769_001164 [Monosporascus sp. CRB-8-3]